MISVLSRTGSNPAAMYWTLAVEDGALLRNLMDHRQVQGYGLEISPELIETCTAKGVSVIDQDINFGLKNFGDDSFDVVVMTQALQTMHHPHLVLEDMLRVGKECIVTFPNFGPLESALASGFQRQDASIGFTPLRVV